MSHDSLSGLTQLPLADHKEIDDICTRFERTWSNERAELETFWTEKTGAKGKLLFCELLKVELECRSREGKAPLQEEYIARFPQQQTEIAEVFQQLHAVTPSLPCRPLPSEKTSPLSGEDNTDWSHWLEPAQQEDEIGRLHGYRVLEMVARGGMGIVLKAEQPSLKRIVALKLLHSNKQAHPEHLQRFRQEAESIARLQHPHIVSIFEIGEHRGCPFLSLEYLPISLAQRLGGAPIPAGDAARLLETLAGAIQMAHDHGIIHRDLKPANILLGGEGATPNSERPLSEGALSLPKVSDFGLAKQVQEEGGLTETGHILGTPSYMAPEQAQGNGTWTSPAVDIYALGAILYELLTGRPPFRAASSFETLQQVVEQEAVPPSRLQPKIPRDLETICLKCLEKDPSNRFVSCTELAEDLRRFLEGKPIRAKPTPPWNRLAKWAKRRPAPATLAAVVVLSVLAVLALWWRFTSDLQVLAHDLKEQRNFAQERRAEAEKQKGMAIQNLKEARSTALQYLRLVRDDAELQKHGLEPLRKKLLEQALRLIEQLLKRHQSFPELQMDLSDAYHELAVLSTHISTPGKALHYYQKGIQVDRQLLKADPGNRAYLESLGVFLLNYGKALYRLGDMPGAQLAYEEGCRHLEAAANRAPPHDPHPYFLLASGHTMLGQFHRAAQRPTKAKQFYDQALKASEECLRRPKSGVPDYRFAHASIYHNLGVLYNTEGKFDQAEEAFQTALTIRKQLTIDSPDYPRYLNGMASTLRGLATLRQRQEQKQQAIALFARALAIQTGLARAHPKVRRYRMAQASLLSHLGDLCRQCKQIRESSGYYRQATSVYADLTKDLPDKWQYASDYLSCILRFCSVATREDAQSALQQADAGLELLKSWTGRKESQPEELRAALEQARRELARQNR